MFPIRALILLASLSNVSVRTTDFKQPSAITHESAGNAPPATGIQPAVETPSNNDTQSCPRSSTPASSKFRRDHTSFNRVQSIL